MVRYSANDHFIMRKIAGNNVLVPVGQQILTRNIIVDLNETAAFMYETLHNECTFDQLVRAVLHEYDGEKETVEKDTECFLQKMSSINAVTVKNDDQNL